MDPKIDGHPAGGGDGDARRDGGRAGQRTPVPTIAQVRPRLLAWLLAGLLAGCASLDPYAGAPIAAHLDRDDAVGACARLFRAADAQVDALGVRDALAPRLAGFPYLRTDRFTASLADDALQRQAGAAWRSMMAELDRQARAVELANAGAAGLPDAAALNACRATLAAADAEAIGLLAGAAQVPDDYRPALRALGLYPLTQLAFAAGVRGWQARTREAFAANAAPGWLPGPNLRYVPASDPGPVPVVAQGPDFGLPQRLSSEWQALLQRHAPVVVVERGSDDDRIGAPAWGAADAAGHDLPRVDTAQPAAYTRIAFTRIADRVHAQLVYTYWFPGRPAEHPLDPLAGLLDGLVWRVTLGADFEPLVYDTMHPCGCYHLFVPTDRVRARPPADDQGPLDEGMFAPTSVAVPGADQRIELHVASRTHYLQRVALAPARDDDAASVPYALRDDDALRALPRFGSRGTRSLFGPDGLVPGTERLERFLFWPMGIASAGQLRQWGRHATAFVGLRHFDDARLFDHYFELRRPRQPRSEPRPMRLATPSAP